MRPLETDYLVVGAGAMGMAFTDALIDHADVHVTLVDRRSRGERALAGRLPVRPAPPGVAVLRRRVDRPRPRRGAARGPEAGLQERARRSEIQAYYDDVLHRRLIGSGRVRFLGGSDHHTDGSAHLVTSRVLGRDHRGRGATTRRRRHLPLADHPGDDTAAVRRRRRRARRRRSTSSAGWASAPSDYVIVGSGKTATDGIVWLLANGVPPDRIVWIRPRDPWMLDRAVVQPDPVGGARARGRHHGGGGRRRVARRPLPPPRSAGVMLRIDRDVTPTMAKTPTLGAWELDLLRTIERVVRLGPRRARDTPTRSSSTGGSVPLPPGSLVVHCAASGLAVPAAASRCGHRTRSGSRRSGPASRASARRWPATWRRPATTTANATACARRTSSPTTGRAGRGCRCAAPSRRAATAPSPTSPPGPTAAPSTRLASSRTQRDDPAVRAAAGRLADGIEPGLARLAELADEPLSGLDPP